MGKENEFFRINWKQDYPGWQEAIDKAMDEMLELTQYKEAKEVIERIKNGNISKT